MSEHHNVTRADIARAIRSAGLAGRPVIVHASLSSFGRVAGGADAVVDGLCDENCTVIVTSFTYATHRLPEQLIPLAQRPQRNAEQEPSSNPPSIGSFPIFDVNSTTMNRWEGAVAAAVTARRGRIRGNHPLDSFAALGPQAQPIIATQTPTDVYAPLREAAADGGYVALMGTDLTKMTLIHAAEELAGRSLFVRWARGQNGSVVTCRGGECSDGFERLSPVLATTERRIVVGSSVWRIFSAAETLAAAAAAIGRTPSITRCPRVDCRRCEDAIAGGPFRRA